jgi:hypothetical protein
MYRMNDLDVWKQRRNELVREAETGRLIRRLKAVRPKGTARLRSMFSARAMEAPAHLCAEDGGRA